MAKWYASKLLALGLVIGSFFSTPSSTFANQGSGQSIDCLEQQSRIYLNRAKRAEREARRLQSIDYLASRQYWKEAAKYRHLADQVCREIQEEQWEQSAKKSSEQ